MRQITGIIFWGILSISISCAQKQAYHWYFGSRGGLDFSSGSPVVTYSPASNPIFLAREGSACISDLDGNLLFYTNGGQFAVSILHLGGLWNANHEMMDPYFISSSSGSSSAMQPGIFIPKPGSITQYYLFTLDSYENNRCENGLHYTLIDKTLNGGLGGIVERDIWVTGTSWELREGMTTVKHDNGMDYWIIVTLDNGTGFRVVCVSDTGITSITNYTVPITSAWTVIKASPDRNKIATAYEIYDFDASTGVISNRVLLNADAEEWIAAFSPNSRFFYQTEKQSNYRYADLYQYDLEAANIQASRLTIGTIGDGTPIYDDGGAQIGPDGKIYILQVQSGGYFDIIHCPNNLGVACNLETNAFVLHDSASTEGGFVNFDDHIFESQTTCGQIDIMADYTYNTRCSGEIVQFWDLSFDQDNLVSWDWNFGDTASGVNNTSTLQNPTHVFNSPGVYTVTLIISDGTNTDTAIYYPEIFHCDSVPLYLTITDSRNSCFNDCDGSVTITPSGGTQPYSYSWSHGKGTDSTAAGLCGDTTYTVTVTDVAANSRTTSFRPSSFTEITVFSGTIDPSDSLTCDAQGILMTFGSEPFTYQWDHSLPNNDTVNGLCADTIYYVTITDANDCQVIDTVQPHFTGQLGLAFSPINPTCAGFCNGRIAAIPSGGDGNYTYLWNDPSSQTSDTAINLCEGTYTVTVEDGGGFIVIDSVVLTDPPAIALTTDSVNATCFGYYDGTAVVHASNGTPPFTFLWNDSLVQTDSIAENLSEGNYTVTVTDANGCTASISTSVEEPAEFIVTIDESPSVNICAGDSIVLHASQGASYVWSPSGYLNSFTIQAPVARPPVSTEYTVFVTDTVGCENSANVIVNVEQPPDAGENGTISVCLYDTTGLFNALEGIPDTGGAWSLPAGGSFSGIFIAGIHSAGIYPYIVNGSGTCVPDTAYITVSVDSLPNVELGDDIDIFTGDNAQLSTVYTGTNYTYQWNPTLYLSEDDIPNPVATPLATTTYVLFVQDTSTGCENSDNITINVGDMPLIIYNTLTPNEDDINDEWIVQHIERYDNKVEVFSRLGELVYEKEQYRNDWKGTYEGKKLPAGTYYYIIYLDDEPEYYGALSIIY